MLPALHAKVLNDDYNQEWNEFVNQSKWGDILQFTQWAQIKKGERWSNLKIGVVDNSGKLILGVQILYKKASILGNYAYVPHGPIFQDADQLEQSLPVLVKYFREIASKYNFFCLEIEPKIGFLPTNVETLNNLESQPNLQHFYDPTILNIFINSGFGVTGRNMQPKHKLYYDLSLDEESLLGLCQKSTRYNIRLAVKKGVKVTEYTPDSPEIQTKIQEFYNLLLETQKRAKGYPVRSLASFQKMFKVFQGSSSISLFEASYNNDIIAMNISQRTKWWSSSFYAASNRLHSEVKAMYLLRWVSIMSAKNFDSRSYDFWGIIPNSDKHSGYSDHKLSFGGQRLDTFGLLALPINGFKFQVWDKGIIFRTKFKDMLRKLAWKNS